MVLKEENRGNFFGGRNWLIEKNDIINAPKGSPDDVINIINSQTINNKVKKKKPKKINFQGIALPCMGKKWMEFLIQYHLEKKKSLLSDHYSKALNILLYSKLSPVE